MKLTLALLATLLSVGLARESGNGPVATAGSIETSLPKGVKTGDVHASVPGGDVHSEPQETRSTVVKPTASKPLTGTEEAIELFNPETILANFQSLIEDPKAEELKEFLEKPTFQKFLKITQNPALQEAVEKFAEKPAVQQCIAEVAAVAEEMQMFAEEMFLVNPLLGTFDPYTVLYEEPVMFEFSFPLVDIVELPEKIAALEKKEKYHGNLFQALDLHNSIFASEEALKFVQEAQVPGCDEDARAVKEYLMEGNNAETYHGVMVNEKKMTLPQQEKPKQQEKPEQKIVGSDEDVNMA